MEFSELPSDIRVRLEPEGERELWKMIDEFGGVKQFSDVFDYSATDLYNWKSKEVFLPVSLVRKVMGSNASQNVVAVKGAGRSRAIEDPRFPLRESDELLTRVSESVSVNREGVPVYQASDPGNLERFSDLLSVYGKVPFSVYSRGVYELRYPKYLHSLFEKMDYQKDFAAQVDETGTVEGGKLRAGGRELDVEDFDAELYHRGKRLALALERGESSRVAGMMAEEASRARDMVQNR